MTELTELTMGQAEQLSRIESLWPEYGHALQVKAAMSGGMGWRTVKGVEYLTRYYQEDGKKKGKSLGRRSPESESLGERKGTLILRARPDTVRVVEQSPQVEYVDADGVRRVHTFDLTVFRADGSKVAVDFKPSALVARSGLRELHALLAAQMSPRTADELLIVTERMYTRDDVFNATLMHAKAREEFPDDDAVIFKLVARMRRPAPIADLVKKSKLAGYGFNAVVRAISAGRLRMVERRRIEYPALVAPVRNKG